MTEKIRSDEVAEDVKDDLLVTPNFPAAPGQPDPKLKPRLPTRTSSELVTRDCAVSKTANHRGCMVALRVPMSVARVIARPGGEPASDLHVTLAYLGDADAIEPDRVAELIERIKTICAHTPPLDGVVSGYGRFRGDDGQDVIWVGYDSADLPDLRHKVVQAVTDSGLELAGDHGFTPHVTLDYVEPGAGEDLMLPAIACEMRWVSVVFGTTESQVRLAGDPHDPADKAPQQPLPQSTVSALMQPAETYTSLYDLEAWAVGRGDLIVRADVDGQPAVVVKKGRDVHVGVLGWEAPQRLDDLVVAMRRIAHDYVISGKLVAKDLMQRWLPREALATVLTGETVATPIFFPSDVLVLDGDLTGHTAAERFELLRSLVPVAGGHVVVPPQLPCGVEDDLERVVDQAMAWRPSEGEGIRVLAVDVLPADSSYEHGPSRALARLSLAEAAKEAFGYGSGPGERPDWREHVPEEHLTEPNFAKPEKKSVLSDVDDGDDTDSGHPTRKYSDEERRDEHGRWAAWATAHGGTFNGVQEGGPRTGDHALITDHHTGSTGAIRVDRMSEQAVRDKMLEIRARFAAHADAHRDMTHKDGGAAPGVFGTPGTAGILAPQQGVFRKPRKYYEVPVDKEFGDNVSIGVPLTMLPTRPTGSQRRRPKADPGGPLFPHYVGTEGTGVHKVGWTDEAREAAAEARRMHHTIGLVRPTGEEVSGDRSTTHDRLAASIGFDDAAHAVRSGTVRFAVYGDSLSLDLRAGDPVAAQRALDVLQRNARLGGSIYVDVVGGVGSTGVYARPWQAAQAIRQAGGLPVEKDAVAKELWSGQGNYAGDGDSFPTAFGYHRFVVGRLRDGRWEDDPEHRRVNPYEAIFQRRVALRKFDDDQPRDDHGRWTSGGGVVSGTSGAAVVDDPSRAAEIEEEAREGRAQVDKIYQRFAKDPVGKVGAPEPKHWDMIGPESTSAIPDQDTVNNYQQTRQWAQSLMSQRAAELYADRLIADGSTTVDREKLIEQERTRMDQATRFMWRGWKGSSTSSDGRMLQLAAHDELGAHLSPKFGLRTDAAGISAMRDDDRYDRYRASVRASWETTQWLAERSGTKSIVAYRGIILDNAKLDGVAHVPESTPGKQFVATALPSLRLQQNGAQSFTASPKVANSWSGVGAKLGPSTTRVVIKADLPATAMLSVPAFGVNMQNEREIVAMGVPFKWRAYLNQAPTGPLHPDAYKRAAATGLVVDLDDPRHRGWPSGSVEKDVQHAVGGESPDARKPRKFPDVGEDMGFNDSYDTLTKAWSDAAREAALESRRAHAAGRTPPDKAIVTIDPADPSDKIGGAFDDVHAEGPVYTALRDHFGVTKEQATEAFDALPPAPGKDTSDFARAYIASPESWRINRALARGKFMGGVTPDRVAKWDGEFTPAPHDIVAFRAIRGDGGADMARGGSFKASGYTSLSTDPAGVSQHLRGENPLVMRMVIPRGTPIRRGAADEREVIVGRGAQLDLRPAYAEVRQPYSPRSAAAQARRGKPTYFSVHLAEGRFA